MCEGVGLGDGLGLGEALAEGEALGEAEGEGETEGLGEGEGQPPQRESQGVSTALHTYGIFGSKGQGSPRGQVTFKHLGCSV